MPYYTAQPEAYLTPILVTITKSPLYFRIITSTAISTPRRALQFTNSMESTQHGHHLHLQPPTPANNLLDALLGTLKPFAQFKARSHETSQSAHLPLLRSSGESPNNSVVAPRIVLLGDSLFERMTTTGQCEGVFGAWPSEAMLGGYYHYYYDYNY
ncbi:hypothetical protein VTK26DRAFT_4961 [Humicola hyalothermophila]